MNIIVTRHSGAVEWLRRKGISGEVVSSLDSDLPENTRVYGVLPLTLAVELLQRGDEVYLIQFPARNGPRGAELTADEMEAGGAKLLRFGLKVVSAWRNENGTEASAWIPGHAYIQPDDDASCLGRVEIVLEDV